MILYISFARGSLQFTLIHDRSAKNIRKVQQIGL